MKRLILLVLSLMFSAASQAEWMGHLAQVKQARLACRNMDSNACQPFLAEAVAVADVIHLQASSKELSAKEIVLLVPVANKGVRQCRGSILQISGESLLQATLGRTDLDENQYWTEALFVTAVNTNCD
jgi:hypothetical protein